MKWIKLKDELPPPTGRSVLLFNPNLRVSRDYPGHPCTVSNPDYARANALKEGWVYWCEIPLYPGEKKNEK